MSRNEIGLREARQQLGDLVTAAQYGTTTVITRNGRPAAMLVAYAPEESTMTITLSDLRDQVVRFLEAGDHGDAYDADAIAATIRDRHGLVNLDDLDPAEFNAILAEHDTQTITYSRTDGEGTERIVITRDGDEIREAYFVDADEVDNRVVYDGTDPEKYLRDRAIDLTSDGYSEV